MTDERTTCHKVAAIFEVLDSVMCDVIKIRLKEGLQREVGKETTR